MVETAPFLPWSCIHGKEACTYKLVESGSKPDETVKIAEFVENLRKQDTISLE